MIEKLLEELKSNGFFLGRMISGSKSLYRRKYPRNLVVFNGNIFVENIGKVWWGDLDLTKDQKLLKEISNHLNVTLYVLNEMNGRFDNENNPNFKNMFIWNSEVGLDDMFKEYYSTKALKLKTKYVKK